jgi:hypothetical protein
VRPEAVTNKDSWFFISSLFSFGIKYTFKLLEADLRVGISRIGARILLSRGRERGLVAPVGGGWLNNHRV